MVYKRLFYPQFRFKCIKSTNDDTVIAEHSDYVWDLESCHPAIINIPQDISSQAISTISFHSM